jgi:hypothetical protein
MVLEKHLGVFSYIVDCRSGQKAQSTDLWLKNTLGLGKGPTPGIWNALGIQKAAEGLWLEFLELENVNRPFIEEQTSFNKVEKESGKKPDRQDRKDTQERELSQKPAGNQLGEEQSTTRGQQKSPPHPTPCSWPVSRTSSLCPMPRARFSKKTMTLILKG